MGPNPTLAQYHYHYAGLLYSTQAGAYSAPGVSTQHVVADEEALPFDTGSFDLATSSLRWGQMQSDAWGSCITVFGAISVRYWSCTLDIALYCTFSFQLILCSLHWVNDLPRALHEVRK